MPLTHYHTGKGVHANKLRSYIKDFICKQTQCYINRIISSFPSFRVTMEEMARCERLLPPRNNL